MSTVDAARELRRALGCFATGVTIVTAPSADGHPIGVTVSSFNSVSLDPPLVLFSIARDARSLPVLRAAEAFAVNVLGHDHAELSNRFARPIDAADGSKWDGVEYAEGFGGAPVIPGAVACFECTPYARYDGGDHEIFVGRVTRHRSDPELAPLLFFRGGYHAVVPRAPLS